MASEGKSRWHGHMGNDMEQMQERPPEPGYAFPVQLQQCRNVKAG
jgi:hypothetical protein